MRILKCSNVLHGLTFIFGFGIGFILNAIFSAHFSYHDPVKIAALKTFGNSTNYEIMEKFLHYEFPATQREQEVQFPPRVLCYFLIGPSTHRSALHIKETWGTRCDATLFFSTKNDSKLNPVVLDIDEGYSFLWGKSKAALRHLYDHHPDFDWYLKADDDTFVIVENLKYFLRDIPPDDPVYHGVKFKQFVKQGYMSGGGGYVLSKEALRRFITIAMESDDEEKCAVKANTGAEDLHLGKCLESSGVEAGDSLDSAGLPRFFSHAPTALFFRAPLINRFHWYWRYLWHHHPLGLGCCSKHLISFHQVDPRMMWTLEALLYRLQVHKEYSNASINEQYYIFENSTLSMPA